EIAREGLDLVVLAATADEESAHSAFLARIREKSGGAALWDRFAAAAAAIAGGAGHRDRAGEGDAAAESGSPAAAAAAYVAAGADSDDGVAEPGVAPQLAPMPA